MKNICLTIVSLFLGSLALNVKANAGPATDALSKCFADSTTGKDRKDMVRWFFTSISVHPDIQNLTSVSDATRTEVDKIAAALIERLLTKDCRDQTINAIKGDGRDAIKNSFKTFGELSAYDLMGNPLVNTAVSGFARHMDLKKIDSLLK